MNLQICPWNHEKDQNDIFHRRDFFVRPTMSASLPNRLNTQPSKILSRKLQVETKNRRLRQNYFSKSQKQSTQIQNKKKSVQFFKERQKQQKDQAHHRLYTYSQYNKSTSEFRNRFFESSPNYNQKNRIQMLQLGNLEFKVSSARPLTSVSRSLRVKTDDNKKRNVKTYRPVSAAKNKRNKAAYQQGLKPKIIRQTDSQVLINERMSILIDMVRSSQKSSIMHDTNNKNRNSLLKNSNLLQANQVITKGSFVYFNRQFQCHY